MSVSYTHLFRTRVADNTLHSVVEGDNVLVLVISVGKRRIKGVDKKMAIWVRGSCHRQRAGLVPVCDDGSDEMLEVTDETD